MAAPEKTSYRPVPRYPAVERDVALVIDRAAHSADIISAVRSSENEFVEDVSVFDVYEGKGIPEGKKSLAVDTRTPEGEEIRDRLIQSADVLLHALLPGAPEKLGLDYERVKRLNSRIIYCRIAGFGNAVKWQARPSFDLLLQALSGQMRALGPENPIYSSIPMADLYAGMVLDYGIVLALSQREETGEGCYVSTSQVAATLGAQAAEFVEYEGMPEPGNFSADSIGSSALHRYYRAKEGWAILAAEDEEVHCTGGASEHEQGYEDDPFAGTAARAGGRAAR